MGNADPFDVVALAGVSGEHRPIQHGPQALAELKYRHLPLSESRSGEAGPRVDLEHFDD